ncbi:MAG: hypothetical protein JXB32_11635 [Deltaproteobacteria bacterium]|nr:hypothetical protein [Deltaproteobacteria bacterium]
MQCTRDIGQGFCEAAATRAVAGLVVETTARAVPVSAGWRVDLQVTVVAADGAAHLVEDEPIRCSGSAMWIGEGLGHGRGCGIGSAHWPIAVVEVLPGQPLLLPGPAEDDCCGQVFAPGWEAELTVTIPRVGPQRDALVDPGPVAVVRIRVAEDGSAELSVAPTEGDPVLGGSP